MKLPAVYPLPTFLKRQRHKHYAALLGCILLSAGYMVVLTWAATPAMTVQAQAATPSTEQPTEQPAEEPTEAPTETPEGYTYTVQRGDNWFSVAARTGVSISELKKANPQSVRSSGWLITGEKLLIPGSQPATPATTTYIVQPGESWSVIAKKFGISIQLLKAANPQSIRYDDVLRRNETLIIPLPADAVTPESTPAADAPAVVTESAAVTDTTVTTTTIAITDTATTTVTAAVTVTPTTSATEIPTATETATAEPTATETATVAPTPTETATPVPEETAAPLEEAAAPSAPCPSAFTDYPTAVLMLLNEQGGTEALQNFLTACNAVPATPLVTQDLTGDGNDDLVLIYQNPDEALVQPTMDLLILNGSTEGFTIGYQARAESEVTLLGEMDVNLDGQNDVAWVETTCGTDTCFDTVQIYSWNGSIWENWTADKITMANAETLLEDQHETGQGLDIVLSGGEYGDAAAGPQRSRTEIWGSVDGTPYRLLEQSYAPSDCLYHAVLDANTAFLGGATDNFEQAETLYTKAATDNSLVACGARENEVTELQSFSLYRLALIAAYRGQADVATDLITSITSTYPDSVYGNVGASWLEAYTQDNAIDSACAVVTAYAAANPAASEILADYGYANPSFTGADICPVIEEALPAPTETAAASETTTEVTTEAITATTATTATTTENGTETLTATVTTTDTAITSDTVTTADGAALATCPEDLAGYVDTLPTILADTEQDEALVEAWLRSCTALDDERGAFRLADLNQDGEEDALFLPTIVSDRGFGPDGAQGAVLLYHGAADGSYTLIENPEIYGLPTLLTVEDLNADEKIDIAWSVEGCSASCISEVQIVTWDGEAYTPIIEPGATIAEGMASFTPIAPEDPGRGKQLVLTGGVSNTPESGLAVPHTEIWQSIDRQPFQRIRWTYDRTVEGANCLGLRLVEADFALQASHVLGYEPAIDLYTNSIDPSLQACSLFGMAAAEELPLLQGLASFRLVQAHAINGDFVAAGEVLTSLSQGQPESDYTKIAQQWLAIYETSGDATAACDDIQTILTENDDLWQITDHYGFNHPALAAEQICYIP